MQKPLVNKYNVQQQKERMEEERKKERKKLPSLNTPEDIVEISVKEPEKEFEPMAMGNIFEDLLGKEDESDEFIPAETEFSDILLGNKKEGSYLKPEIFQTPQDTIGLGLQAIMGEKEMQEKPLDQETPRIKPRKFKKKETQEVQSSTPQQEERTFDKRAELILSEGLQEINISIGEYNVTAFIKIEKRG